MPLKVSPARRPSARASPARPAHADFAPRGRGRASTGRRERLFLPASASWNMGLFRKMTMIGLGWSAYKAYKQYKAAHNTRTPRRARGGMT